MNAIRAVVILGFVCLSAMGEATTLLGPGSASCGTWSGDRQRNQSLSQLNQAWVLGFVSSYNVYKAQDGTTKPVDSRAIMLWVDNYCDANPDQNIADAAKALIDDLTGRAQ